MAPKLHLGLNLQKISMVSIATMLWDTVEMKKQIKTHYLEMSDLMQGEERHKCLSCITETVLHYLNSEVPSCLLAELKETITLIGGKIYNWILYVTEKLRLDFKFCEKMYWTSYGIDEAKIFNCYWRELMSTKDFRTSPDRFKHSTAFTLACIYGCDRLINDHVNEMTEELGDFYPFTSLTTDEIYDLMTLYICSYLNQNFDKNSSRPVKMFKLCVKEGFSKSAKFWWTKLNETEKNSDLFRFVLEHCYDEENDRKIFIQEKHCEILYFLISKLGEEEIHSVFEVDGDKIIQTFLSVWPYQELIFDLLDYNWGFECCRLMRLCRLTLEWKRELRRSKCHLLDERYFQILKLFWDKFSEEEKEIFVYRYVESSLMIGMVLNSDFRTLNLILKDTVIKGKDAGRKFRKEVLEACVFLLGHVKTFSAVDELIEKMFNSNPVLENDPLKVKFKTIATFIAKQNESDVANQCMKWLSNSDEEKFRLKSEIDSSLVCFEMIEVNFCDSEMTDDMLRRRFETEADVRNFKEEMKSINFIRERGENSLHFKSTWDLSDSRLGDYISWIWAGGPGNENSELFTIEAYSIFKIVSHLCH